MDTNRSEPCQPKRAVVDFAGHTRPKPSSTKWIATSSVATIPDLQNLFALESLVRSPGPKPFSRAHASCANGGRDRRRRACNSTRTPTTVANAAPDWTPQVLGLPPLIRGAGRLSKLPAQSRVVGHDSTVWRLHQSNDRFFLMPSLPLCINRMDQLFERELTAAAQPIVRQV
jgi:hypothetical protein